LVKLFVGWIEVLETRVFGPWIEVCRIRVL
jgi:hypothetical protein